MTLARHKRVVNYPPVQPQPTPVRNDTQLYPRHFIDNAFPDRKRQPKVHYWGGQLGTESVYERHI